MQHRSVRWPVLAWLTAVVLVTGPVALAHHPDDGLGQQSDQMHTVDPSDALVALDASSDIISDGPSGKTIKNLQLRGRGKRLVPNATTDVWAHGDFAYTGTFQSPCGGEEGAGIWVWDIENKNKPSFVTLIESETGSRSNDVKVATMNSGDILVHSNENCGPAGRGGFEVYNVDDPSNPVHLATVRVHEANETLRTVFGGVNRGVHNLFLFTQGSRDFVGVQTHAWFGGFQIFELTDPANPELVTAWGAELLCEESYCSDDPYNETNTTVLVNHINGFMFCTITPCFGFSQNRFLHDVTITEDGNLAYLSHWDAGLILLDISDVANPEVVSIALDPENGSRDGEVNSHSSWPSEDGTIVVEGEEDFNAWNSVFPEAPPTNLTFGEGTPPAPLPGVAIATGAGDDFEASQTGNAGTVDADSLEVTSGPLAGNTYDAAELAGDQPRFADTGPISGDIVYIGQACNPDPILNPAEIGDGGIAIARRGGCTFREKNFNAAAAGADAVVIANNIPVVDTPWSGLRIWDYSDPENPVLASLFDTVCSASPDPIPECDPFGTYSAHNVIVETTDDGRVKAYVSWYYDGMLVLDVTDPYNPKEIARYFDNSPEFLESNGGQPHNFWGVDKIAGEPWIYGSDRNGGLYIFKEQGSGSGKK